MCAGIARKAARALTQASLSPRQAGERPETLTLTYQPNPYPTRPEPEPSRAPTRRSPSPLNACQVRSGLGLGWLGLGFDPCHTHSPQRARQAAPARLASRGPSRHNTNPNPTLLTLTLLTWPDTKRLCLSSLASPGMPLTYYLLTTYYLLLTRLARASPGTPLLMVADTYY